MQKKVLSQIDIYADDVKVINIDRQQLKNDIIQNYIKKNRMSNNPLDYSYKDYKIPFSKTLQWFKDYIIDHFRADHDQFLILKKEWGNIYESKEMSVCRNQIDPNNLKYSADYTLIYGVDVEDNSCKLVIEYDDNRRKGRTWHLPLKNNRFIIFPATQKYFISPNKAKKLNTFLTLTYEAV